MSEKKGTKLKNVENAAAGVALVASVLPLVKPAIDAVHDYADKTIEERKKLVSVPELYSKEYPLTIEQAVELLRSCGLKAMPVKISIKDADIQYRCCFDSQVLKTHPKAKQKVEPGSSVLIKYITQEVIDESSHLFEELEKRKVQAALEKSEKRTERKEKTKQVISGVSNTVKGKLRIIPSVFRIKNNDNEEEQDEQK